MNNTTAENSLGVLDYKSGDMTLFERLMSCEYVHANIGAGIFRGKIVSVNTMTSCVSLLVDSPINPNPFSVVRVISVPVTNLVLPDDAALEYIEKAENLSES